MNTSKIISSLTSLKTAVLGILVVLLAGVVMESRPYKTPPERNWELAWSDDFTGVAGSAPDAGKWAFDIGTGSNGWGNSELQYYTNRPENIKLDGNGMLVITAKSESYAGSGFTSARIKTKGIVRTAIRAGSEARIKTPTGPGLWPASGCWAPILIPSLAAMR